MVCIKSTEMETASAAATGTRCWKLLPSAFSWPGTKLEEMVKR